MAVRSSGEVIYAFVPCKCCKGTGKVAVTGVYADTLHGLRRWCKHPGRYVVAHRDA